MATFQCDYTAYMYIIKHATLIRSGRVTFKCGR